MSKSEDKLENTSSPTSRGLAEAINICRLRGAQITPLREAVLTALWSAERPLGAYDLRDRLADASGRRLSAPSIYRTLDFLCEQGVATRIESRNAYVACAHPEHEHACVILVCDACGDAKEVENQKVEKLISEDARRLGFAVRRRVFEISGLCAPCQQTS